MRKIVLSFILVVYVALISLLIFRGTFAKEADAIAAAKSLGYTEVSVLTKTWSPCGMYERCHAIAAASFDLSASTQNGDTKTITICSSWPRKGMFMAIK